MTQDEWEKKLRKKMLRWHYDKSRSINIVDLLESCYQVFRSRVERRLNMSYRSLDFREAIKKATLKELEYLQATIDEKRLKI